MKLRICLSCALVFLMSVSAYSQDSLSIGNMHRVEIGWDELENVHFRGNYAYISTGRTGIKIYDISDMENIEFCSQIEGEFSSMGLFGDFQVIVHRYGTNQVEIYNLQDPFSPVLSEMFYIGYSGSSMGFCEYGDYLFVTMTSPDSHLLDISDEYNPIDLGEIDFRAQDVLIQNHYMIPIAYRDVSVYDITNPLEPVLFDTDFDYERTYEFKTVNDSVFVVQLRNSLEFLSVSEQDSIVRISSLQCMPSIDIAIAGDYLFQGMSNGYDVFDISDPANPDSLFHEVAACPILFNYTDTIVAGSDPDYLYNKENSLAFFSMDQMPDIVISGMIDNDNSVNELAVLDTLLVCAETDGLNFYKWLSSDSLQTVYSYPEFPGHHMAMSNRYIYLFEITNFLGRGYEHTLNIEDPSNVYGITSNFISDDYEWAWVEMQDNQLFIMENMYRSCFNWFEITQLGEYPEKVRKIYDSGEDYKWSMKAYNDKLVVSHNISGDTSIEIFDIIAPEKYEMVAFTDVMDMDYNSYAVYENYLYIINNVVNTTKFDIFNINDENAILPIATVELPYIARGSHHLTKTDMKVYGNYLFASFSSYEIENDIIVYDLSDPLSPVEIGHYANDCNIDEFVQMDEFIFATNGCYLYQFETDLPLPSEDFDLISPSNSIEYNGVGVDTLHFVWEESVPSGGENVSYDFHLRLNHPVDGDIYYEDNGTGTEIDVNIHDLISTVDITEPIYGIWWVNAVTSEHTKACRSPFRFRITPASDVDNPGDEADIPLEYALQPAYPNPFNPLTTLTLSLPETSQLSLKVYNHLGQEVQNLCKGQRTAGIHKFTFNAEGLAAGIYFAQAVSENGWKQTHKMVLLK